MTAGHTFSQQGEPRRKFYDKVLRVADEVRSLDIMICSITLGYLTFSY
jgi:hypothetical protein